jgi:hypothetical protein
VAGRNLRRRVDVEVAFRGESLYEVIEKLGELFLGVFASVAAKRFEVSGVNWPLSMSASSMACLSASSERSFSSLKSPHGSYWCWPAKPDCSRKSASFPSSDCRSMASAISGLNFEYVCDRMVIE